MITSFRNQDFILDLRYNWKRSSIAIKTNKQAIPVKTDEQIKQEKILILAQQIAQLSGCDDITYMTNQIVKTVNNPYQTRQSDRRSNTAEFRIDINQSEVESEVKRMNELIKKVKELRSK